MSNSIRDIKAINLHREYILNVDPLTLIDLINKQAKWSDSFILYRDESDGQKFKLESINSLGTGMVTELNLSAGPITLYGSINSLESNRSQLRITTRTRIEVIIMAILAIAMCLFIYFSEDEIPLWVYLIPVGALLWFQMIYRWQEKGMLEEIEKVTGKPVKK